MIPLTLEEYFDVELCTDCHEAVSLRGIALCAHCAFGLYTCATCEAVVSHLPDTRYREMVYTGPQDRFDGMFVLCGECAGEEDGYDTDAGEGWDGGCKVDTPTRIMW